MERELKKNIVKQVLESVGPCVSSVLAEKIKIFYPMMSPDAIRKMISRSEDVGKLKFVIFSHNRRFIYLKNDFGSIKFWRALENCLYQTNSVYSHALLSIINNGGYLKARDFGIACGSPIRQSKHIGYETVLSNLIASNILRVISVDSVGDCIVLNNNYSNDPGVRAMAHSESFFDKPILELIKSWLRNIGLVAFNQVKTKYDDETNPIVGSFEWGMTAPSYASPLAEYVDGKLVPGFVVCDFSLGFCSDEITTSAADTFIRKVQLTKLSRANQRIMFVFFARRFGKESFRKLRNSGVLAITIASAFGNKVDESLNRLSAVVKGSLSIEKHPNELLKIVQDLESISGENGNLRGYIFELFVSSQAITLLGSGNVTINKEYNINGSRAEGDVILEGSDDIYIIECKNVTMLPSPEVTRWIKKRIPIINSYYKENNPEGKSIHHYMWVTGMMNKNDIKRLESFKAVNKKKDIDFLFGKGLDDFFYKKKRVFDLYRKVIKPKYTKGFDFELDDESVDDMPF